MGVAVGIDLGTTNSCVAIVQGEQAKIVESVYGDRIHPSIICFHPSGEVLAGPRAKERLAIDPENTIYSFKRLLGQDINAPEIQKLITHLPYNVTERNGIPILQTRNKEATLPEVSALMLKYLREMVSETYGVDIREAIITVPANFTDVQRASTKIAGRIAGFNVLRILNEPTAAALAYGFGGEKEERIAVYDFGGGTFDITIIELLDDIFEVLSTAGDNFLGGDDFDDKIVYEMLTQFKKQHGFNIEDNPIAMQRVRSVAERAKCQLSSIDEVNATLRELITDKKGRKIDFSFTITRERFEALSASLVERSLATCEEALELAKLTPADLDNVVLVGGSTRVPLVRRKVEEFFGKKPRTEVNPDEVVAIGAAINAFSLTQEALDKNISARKHANPKVDPFAGNKSVSSDPPTPMQDSSGLAQTVRSSKVPKPRRSSIPPSARSAGRPDPFAQTSSPLAGMSDPFADSARAMPLDDPFADAKSKQRPSLKPPKPLGKIELGKRTMIGMGTSGAGKGSPSHTDLPALKQAQEEEIADLPALVEERNADFPDLASGYPADNSDLPVPKQHFDNELDTWGESNPLAESIDLDSDLPIPKQVARSKSDDPDLPVPLKPADDADLPIPMGPPSGMDLPTTKDDDGLDLPIPLDDDEELDLPIPMGPAGSMDLPAIPNEETRDLPIPVGISDDFDLETDLETSHTIIGGPAVSAPGIPDDFIIESESDKARRDVTESFDQTGSRRIDSEPPVMPDDFSDFEDSTDELESLDDMEVEEVSEPPAPPLHTPPIPARQNPFFAGTSAPSKDLGFGEIDLNAAFETPSIPPPASPSYAPPRMPSFAPPASQMEMDAPRMPSYHPYHPLDEVVGDDGKEAKTEEHAAFSVPIKKATPAVLLDVSPRGLGIATAGGYCDIIIERNAAIPIEQSRHFSTSRDHQTEVFIDVYQGESRRTEDNTLLGRIELRDIRPAPRGEISILVTFEVDTDGMFNVKALNEETQATQSTQIKLSGGLADDQVSALVEKYSGNA
ncbi:MAG: Hsp70 family protein [Deltaproteobacteria bacterium]|nr:Hsp70 family protein [Deltaproteobacteria bacterium]MBN2672303.1 Hsp70 family protein [Deltaproteobacteria bacterium]